MELAKQYHHSQADWWEGTLGNQKATACCCCWCCPCAHSMCSLFHYRVHFSCSACIPLWGNLYIASVISMPNPPVWSAFVPDPTLIQTEYLHWTLPQTYTVLRIGHPSSLPSFFHMLYLLLVSSLSIVYLRPFIVTMLSHMSSFATIPPPYAFSIPRLYPHALHTFPHAPPSLHLIPNPIIIVYKSSVLCLCTLVHISTKSSILSLEVPLHASCSSPHLCTSIPLKSRTMTLTRVWHTSLCQLLIKSPLSYLHRTLTPFLYCFLHQTWARRTRTWQ